MGQPIFNTKQTASEQAAKGSFLDRTAVVWKMALGSLGAWELAVWTGSKHPYLAPLTLILCLQATIGQSLRFALIRTAGTVFGVLMIAWFAEDIPVTGLSLSAVLLISAALMKTLKLSDAFIHQVALSILFVLYFEQHPSGYAFDRVKDTIIGSLVAVLLVTLLFPPDPSKGTEKQLVSLVVNLADEAETTSRTLQAGHTTVARTLLSPAFKTLFSKLDAIERSLQQAQQSSPFNPYDNPVRLKNLQQRVDSLTTGCIHFAALTQILAIWLDSGQMSQYQQQEWTVGLRKIAAALKTWKSEFMKSDSRLNLTVALPAVEVVEGAPSLASTYSQIALYHASKVTRALDLSTPS